MITESDIQGHWIRRWIKAPDFEDHDTRVHWMQAGALYADVRIPQNRPNLSRDTNLSGCSAQELRALARSEGFAGHVTLDGQNCTWHRDINWHGTPEGLDIGAITFDEAGHMLESGVLADYTELWVQNAQDVPQAMRFHGAGYQGVLVSCGAIGVLAIGRYDKPASGPLVAALEAGELPEGIGMLFDGLHALCEIDGNTVIAILATDPRLEGVPVLSLNDDVVIWHARAFDSMETKVKMLRKY